MSETLDFRPNAFECELMLLERSLAFGLPLTPVESMVASDDFNPFMLEDDCDADD